MNIMRREVFGVDMEKKNPCGVPMAGAFVTYVLIMVYQCFDIETILVFTNTAGSVAGIIEWAACIKMRWYHKSMKGEYVVPIESDWGFFVFLTPTQFINIFYIIYAVKEQFGDPESSIAEIGFALFVVSCVQVLVPVLVGLAWALHFYVNGKTGSIDMVEGGGGGYEVDENRYRNLWASNKTEGVYLEMK
jgi:hypothetical protein